jgi:hypothetical protein
VDAVRDVAVKAVSAQWRPTGQRPAKAAAVTKVASGVRAAVVAADAAVAEDARGSEHGRSRLG